MFKVHVIFFYKLGLHILVGEISPGLFTQTLNLSHALTQTLESICTGVHK